MTTDDDHSDAAIEDPEWIKGLVAKALLQAAEDEDPSAPPRVLPPDASVEAARPPFDESPVEPGGRNQSPSPASTEPASGAATLRVGRGFEDTPMLTDLPIADWPDTSDTRPSESAASVPAATVTLEAEPVGGSSEPPDHVMVEQDATVEGFRSSDIRTVLEWLAVIVSALVVALLIKAFVLQAFWIPSPSMETTVNQGDRILVNKLSYRLHDVRRGDLVVFKKPQGVSGDTEDLIKRAIALPGETIEVRDDGRIYIWGAGETPGDALLLDEPYLDPQNARLSAPSSTDSLIRDIWDEQCVNQPRNPGRCTLGENQYFMMGDNRNSSSDSRTFGPITEELIVGRAFLRIWPIGDLSSL